MAYEYADGDLFEIAPFACGSAHQVESIDTSKEDPKIINYYLFLTLGSGLPPKGCVQCEEGGDCKGCPAVQVLH